MTAIVGLTHNGQVWMGGDSAGIAGYSLTVRADEKVFVNGPFIFGFTTSFRMGQLLRYAFIPPDRDPRMDADKFMVTTFINAVRDCLKAGGYAERENEAESGGEFLVGYEGNLYHVQSDYQVAKAAEPFAACGCGRDAALGALYILDPADKKIGPAKCVTLALMAAERFSAGVRGPFNVISMKAA